MFENTRLYDKKLLFLDTLRGNPMPWPVQLSRWFVLKDAYLLMDASPATLRDNASQSWTGTMQIARTLLEEAYVTPRGHDKVISAVFQGSADNITELFFFTVAENSSRFQAWHNGCCPGGSSLSNLPHLSRKSPQSFSTERALRQASTPKWLWKTTQQCFMQSCTREVEQKVT